MYTRTETGFSLFIDIKKLTEIPSGTDCRHTPVVYNSPTKQESISKDW